MTKIEKIQPYRRIVEIFEAVVILSLPFVRIGGESALRFDIPSLRLHFFGISLWMDEFFIVLIGLIFLIFFIILITILFGRIWCGWACPQTVLVDFTRFFDRTAEKSLAYRAGSYLTVFAVSGIVAASLIWYFVSPYEFFSRLFSGGPGNMIIWFWTIMTGLIFLDFAFLRHTFCATVCPYAKLQSVVFDNKTLAIAFDRTREEECINCRACVRTCPVGIDIRNGLNQACINCAECIDKCMEVMNKKGRKGLIYYFFGLPGSKEKILRQNPLMIGAITLFFFVFLLYLSSSRTILDMTVLPNYNFTPRVSAGGDAVNSYLLSIENKGRLPMELVLTAAGFGRTVKISPEKTVIEGGEKKLVPVYVSANVARNGKGTAVFEIRLESPKPGDMKIMRKVNFEMLEQ